MHTKYGAVYSSPKCWLNFCICLRKALTNIIGVYSVFLCLTCSLKNSHQRMLNNNNQPVIAPLPVPLSIVYVDWWQAMHTGSEQTRLGWTSVRIQILLFLSDKTIAINSCKAFDSNYNACRPTFHTKTQDGWHEGNFVAGGCVSTSRYVVITNIFVTRFVN